MKTHYVVFEDGLYVLRLERYRGTLHPQAVISASPYLSSFMHLPWGTRDLPELKQVDFSKVK